MSFRHNNAPVKVTRSLLIAMLLCAGKTVYAEESYSFTEESVGTTSEPPLQLEKYPLGENSEKHFPPNQEFTLWTQDETFFKPQEEDKVEIKKVLEKETETFKLEGKVPAIGFKSGEANIPESYVEKLRDILDEMKNRTNVRLHFIGHSDSDKLSGALRAKYINNIGLSKYRAQETAEYFQRELDLPPDGVSFDGAGDSKPIASNNTAAGKAKNRRVEVQVWYDEITEKAVEKEFVIPAKKLNRLKVCRKETVCKLSYKEGNARRARLQNLVKPLRTEAGQAGVPKEWIHKAKQSFYATVTQFSAHRMVWEYLQKFYIPAMQRSEKYSQEEFKGLHGFTKWKNRVARLWPKVSLQIQNGSGMDEDRRILSAGEQREITLEVSSAGLDPKDIQVEIVLERQDAYMEHQSMKIIPMGMIAKNSGDRLEYRAQVMAETDGSYRYNCRVFPKHADHFHLHETRLIKWLD